MSARRKLERVDNAALAELLAAEADKLLAHLAKQADGANMQRKRKNLEKLHQHLVQWIEKKLSAMRGLSDQGEGDGNGPRTRTRTEKEHLPPKEIRLHREKLDTLNGIHSNAAGFRRWLEQKSNGHGHSHDHPHPHPH